MPKQLDWQRAVCPICNKQYVYLPAFKPVTCGKSSCVSEADKKGLLNKVEIRL